MSVITYKEKPQLPAGWQWVTLGDVVDCCPGAWGEEFGFENSTAFRIVGTSNISNDGFLDIEDAPLRHLSQHEMQAVCFTNDLLVVKSSGSAANIRSGKTAICPKELSGIIACANFLMRLTPRLQDVDPYLLWQYLNCENAKTFVRSIAGSSTYPNIKWGAFKNLQIPLPCLPEQKRISNALSRQMATVEAARTASQARLEALKALPSAFAQRSLRAGRKHRHHLGDCLTEVKNGIGQNWAQYPVLGATREGLAPAKEPVGKTPERYKLVDPVTVFYNPMRILLGSIAMVDEGDESGITSPDYVVLKGQEGILDTRWFYYWFRSSEGAHLIESLSRGAVRERILFKRLATGEIEIPNYEAQLSASRQMAQVRPMIEAATQELEAINALPATLLRRAFNGEL